ncbi:MAG: hypothetical protein RR523_07710 [Cetobacterium sp.]|uniref:hypothetical protein n=1 Tax=Cetobacterium sp. TaxID=2071632 RepID=UPI002FCAEE81
MKLKMGSLIFLLGSVSLLADDMVLVPLANGNYEKINLEEVIPKFNSEVKNEEEIEEFIKVNEIMVSNVNLPSDSILEDLLKIGIDYENNKYKLKEIENNKNIYQRQVASDFLKNSNFDKNIYEDTYLFSINTFGENTKYENASRKIKLNNTGAIIGIQYGITDEINTKFNIGYSNSEILSEKGENLYLSIDTKYVSVGEIYYDIGLNIGYLHGKNPNYKVKDMLITLLYGNLNVPLTETIELKSKIESTILSNKVELGILKNIEFDYFDFGVGLSSEYIFNYKDKDIKLYTHINDKKPTAKLELDIKAQNIKIKPFYEFVNNGFGIGLEYKF